ncbi:glycosyltransferase family 2 protein [Sporolactobacillus pectinivorans]|uniref:glycosyltransferase family 2 protein n=1 Tax=Sporolactobacillus pectinivorans TaxID=1591408 RepID=UPI000C25CC15|nr:glycosyltransferase [Sporolactobacillus pectinivorans]
MRPEISVIVPVYNVEHYLQRCIRSVLAQSFISLEIILVDDGSTDHSGRICDLYRKRDDRIRVIHKENGGLSDARNMGVRAATGKYIGFVDSDDFIDRDMYYWLYRTLIENTADIAEAGFLKAYSDVAEKENNETGRVTVYSGRQAAVSGIVNHRCTTYAWNKLYKRELWDTFSFPKGKLFEDEFTTYKVFHACTRVAVIDRKLYYYFQRKTSIAHASFTLKSLDHCEALSEMIQFIEKQEPEALPIVSIKYLFSNIWHLQELLVNRKKVPDSKPVINRMTREIIFYSKYLGRKKQFAEAASRILVGQYYSLYGQRKKIIFMLFLLKRSVHIFFVTLVIRKFVQQYLVLQRKRLSN